MRFKSCLHTKSYLPHNCNTFASSSQINAIISVKDVDELKQIAFATSSCLQFRQCLHPHAVRNGIELPKTFFQYYNVCNEYKIWSGKQDVPCLKEVAEGWLSFYFISQLSHLYRQQSDRLDFSESGKPENRKTGKLEYRQLPVFIDTQSRKMIVGRRLGRAIFKAVRTIRNKFDAAR